MMTAGIKRTWIGIASTLFVLTFGTVASAQTMADYQAQPEFISDAVPPNILMLMDNSGSMNMLAYGNLTPGGTSSAPTGSPVTPFDPTKDYHGIFNPLRCYQYDSSGNKFAPSSSDLGSVGATCTNASYPWHGNLLNYVTVRRLDVVKWVMVGGNCGSGNLGAGTCNLLKGQDQFVNIACCKDVTAIVRKGDATGRMPSGDLPADDTSMTVLADTRVYFHHKGSDTNHRGFFCVDNDNTMTDNNVCTGGDTGDGYIEKKYGIKADISASPLGVVQSIGKKARMGMMQFHDGTGDGSVLKADVGAIPGSNGVQEDMVNAVSSMIATSATPLSESLYTATRYFAQAPPVYTTTDYPDNVDTRDPYWFKSGGNGWANPAQLVKCCKSFVIIFTDGSPTYDTRVPPSMQDYAHSALGHGSGDQTGHHDVCSTYWGGPTNDSCPPLNQGTHYLDDVAYYAHTKDLRPDTGDLVGLGKKSGSDIVDGDFAPPNESRYRLPGKQSLDIYTFLAFGSGQEILKAAARAGGFEDANGNGIPDNGQTPAGPCVSGGACEYDKRNNGNGLLGPDGDPDNYFFSRNADDLKDRLLATINSILQRSASGTAASVLANSSTGEGALYQAFFYPRTTEASKDVAWAGYVKGFFVDTFGNIREDSRASGGAPDGRLVYEHDPIIKMEYDSSLNKVVVKRYADTNPADGKADSTTPIPGPIPDIREVKGIWEAGDKLASKDPSTRKLHTWVDKNNDGIVDANERIQFKTGGTEVTDLTPYLNTGLVGGFTIGAADLIDFIRGCEPGDCTNQSNFRYRTLTSSAGQRVWKLGDPVHSTPTVVAAPRERYDVLYGDGSYSKFFKDYRCRRNVIYVGANDGMLHAFNGGFYNRGDKSGTSEVEHGYFELDRASTCPGLPATLATPTPTLGEELWGFIPMQALPHLRWLADPKYSHVYYIDAKPKVSDVRIFCTTPTIVTPCINGQDGVTHTEGWGTILIGAFRFGGSCGNATCASGSGAVKKMTVTNASFSNGTTRTFLSAYFVLDITDPEQPPKLLWSFSEQDLGFTTSYPAIARVKPSCSTLNCKTDPADAQWLALFGSGPTNHNVDTIAQSAKMYAVNLIGGPGAFASATLNTYGSANIKKMVVESSGSSMMGDMATVDLELDYRVNVSYAGSTIGTGSPWTGKLYRLSTPCPGDPCWNSWGIDDGAGGRSPTVVVDNFISSAGTLNVGPVSAGVTVTKDDANQVWVFFGTGRYWSVADRTLTDQQYFFGIKDSVHSGTCSGGETTLTGCRDRDLVDVSAAKVCLTCANPVSGVSEGSTIPTTLLGSTTTTLQGLVATKRGWFTKLPLPATSTVPADPLERVLVTPTLAGGIVFFPSFVPKDDLCISLGNGYLYALFYQTGSAHTVPVLGTTTNVSGDKISNRNIFLGEGQISQLGVHIGSQGSGAVGGGCTGNMAVIGQTSTGAIVGSCTNTQGAWSKYISWKDQRD